MHDLRLLLELRLLDGHRKFFLLRQLLCSIYVRLILLRVLFKFLHIDGQVGETVPI